MLQRVSRKSGPEPAVGIGYGETLRWFGPIADAAARGLLIEYAERVLAAGAFVPPGVELQALAFDPAALSGNGSAVGRSSNNAVAVGASQADAADLHLHGRVSSHSSAKADVTGDGAEFARAPRCDGLDRTPSPVSRATAPS